jgi:Phosphotransferase enzyme family
MTPMPEPAGEPATAGAGRRFAGPESLASVVRAAFGPGRRLAAVDRLRGGSKKGVYRLTFDDGATVIGYLWNAAENYWPAAQHEAGESHADPFSDASGADLFEASHAYLDGLGVRVPQVYLLDRSRAAYPADIALVEDVRGESLETRLERGLPGADQALAQLAAAVSLMHQQRGPRFGKLAYVLGSAGQDASARDGSAVDGSTACQDGAAQEGTAQDAAGSYQSCEQVVLDRALADLDTAAARVERLAAAGGRLADLTRELAAAVPVRAQYGLIHGELGPDHVLIDGQGRPVIIDIEGVMFFDVEWEHAFLELRFGEHYWWLRASDLDDQRLRFYRLALCLSLIAGPLRLLDGDYPDREPMLEIVEYNIARALACLKAGARTPALGRRGPARAYGERARAGERPWPGTPPRLPRA